MNPIVISSDEIKKTFRGYNPQKAEKFHHISAILADKEFKKQLKITLKNKVILMCGGSASGKTEFVSEYLNDFDGIVFDGTLFSIEGARVKIRNIQKFKKTPIVCAVIPDDLKRAFNAFLHRDRQFSDSHFYRTHSGARKTLLWIAEHMPEIEIKIYESFLPKKQDIIFQEYIFQNHKQKIEFLKKSQYTEEDIVKIINS